MKQLIPQFEYSKLLKKYIASERVRGTYTNDKRERSLGNLKQSRIAAIKKINTYIKGLRSGNANDKEYAKLLMLEREYIHAYNLRELRIKIENTLGCDPNGAFTLAECGKVLGVTRERARQLEDSAVKALTHPDVLRALRPNITE